MRAVSKFGRPILYSCYLAILRNVYSKGFLRYKNDTTEKPTEEIPLALGVSKKFTAKLCKDKMRKSGFLADLIAFAMPVELDIEKIGIKTMGMLLETISYSFL